MSTEGAASVTGPGTILVGRYRVGKLIGEGGMASVWEGEHLRLGQRVAIKMLHAQFRENADVVLRLEREGRAIARLRTRHVVRVLDVDTTETSTPFLVMEYLEGCSLDAELATRGSLPIGEAVAWIIDACSGVGEAHALGVVHRDLKPSNLFLAAEHGGRVMKVLDFGVSRDPLDDDARLTKTQSILGTPLYMAPEQFRGAKDVDARADVWALGATLYEMIGGRAPFENAEGLIAIAIVSDPLPPIAALRPEIPPGLVRVLEKALAKDRKERFASAPELAEALAPFASTADVVGMAPSVTIRQTLSARPDAHTVATGVSSNAASLAATPDLSTGAGAAATSEVGGSIVSAPSSRSRSRLGLGALVLVGAVAVLTAGLLSFHTTSRSVANMAPDGAAPRTVSTAASNEPTTEAAATPASVTTTSPSAPATSASAASASASLRVTRRPLPPAPSVRRAPSPSPSATSPIFFPQ